MLGRNRELRVENESLSGKYLTALSVMKKQLEMDLKLSALDTTTVLEQSIDHPKDQPSSDEERVK